MTTNSNQQNRSDSNSFNEKDSLSDSVRILSDLTRRDIEKSYNIDSQKDLKAIRKFLKN